MNTTIATTTPAYKLERGQTIYVNGTARVLLAVVSGEDTVSVVFADDQSEQIFRLTQDVQTAPLPGDAKRAEAAAARQRVAESWERSDTDGFMSQWAGDVNARRLDAEADLLDAGGVAEFPALFDAATGELVAAKLVDGRFGPVWGLLPSDDADGRFTGWVNESKAGTAEKRRAALVRKGYTLGTVRAGAYVTTTSGLAPMPYSRRADGGFSRDVEIVSTDVLGWY